MELDKGTNDRFCHECRCEIGTRSAQLGIGVINETRETSSLVGVTSDQNIMV